MVTPKCSAQEIRHGAAGRDKHGRGADGPPPERAARRGDDRSRSRAAAGCCDDREAARRARVAGRSRRLLSSRESGGKRKQAMSGVGEAHVTRKLTAILAADVVGFSRLMGVDEEGTLERMKAHRKQLIDPKIAEHQGRIVKTTGDGLLVEFSSVVDAVRCAVEIQRGMSERNADLPPDRRIDLRIGINLGDVIVEGGDIFGDGVNVAARLEASAEPGGICISRTVRDHIRDKLAYRFDDMGEQSVKNIARPVRVFALRPEAVADLPASSMPPAAPISQPVVAPRMSIVVLPFANLSNDPEQQYFADGITEDLTTDLSRIAGVDIGDR